jgi:ABC-2 type transport system permease protein
MTYSSGLQVRKKQNKKMRKIIILARREYRTAVRTKGFIIGLLLAPVFMGGSGIVFALMKDKVDLSDKHIAIIDRSGIMTEYLAQAIEERNKSEIYNQETGEQIKPAYYVEFINPDTADVFQQKLELSNKVRSKQLHAFIEIGPEILHPVADANKSGIKYYSENSALDIVRDWFSGSINNHIRQLRIKELNMDDKSVNDLFSWINLEGLGLISIDKKTGTLQDARQIGVGETIIIPYIMVFLMFLMLMMSAIPLLTAVMEEKMNRIAEVLLGSVTPFQFMMGKILGSIAVSLTASAVYVIGGIITARQLGAGNMIPYDILPWFFAFLILNIIMVGSGMAALGSACNDNKDAQSWQFPAMMPVILPLFIMMPVIQEPLSSFSTSLSLFPPFTPMLMLLRMSTPVSIPIWQPVVGLIGVIIFTVFSVWAGGRIFRTCILMQGQKPKLGNLIKYVVKG